MCDCYLFRAFWLFIHAISLWQAKRLVIPGLGRRTQNDELLSRSRWDCFAFFSSTRRTGIIVNCGKCELVDSLFTLLSHSDLLTFFPRRHTAQLQPHAFTRQNYTTEHPWHKQWLRTNRYFKIYNVRARLSQVTTQQQSFSNVSSSSTDNSIR